MKLIISSIALLVPVVMSGVSEVTDSSLPEDFEIRDLKGSKGKGKGKGAAAGCSFFGGGPISLNFLIKEKELEVGGNNATITTLSGPATVKSCDAVWDFDSASVGRGDDCVQLISLRQNKNTQLTVQGACGQRKYSVTGGTGKLVCASGEVDVTSTGRKITMAADFTKACN